VTDSHCCVCKLLSSDKRAVALALIPLHHSLPHPLSHGDMEGPQHPITMTDGVSGIGEEKRAGVTERSKAIFIPGKLPRVFMALK